MVGSGSALIGGRAGGSIVSSQRDVKPALRERH
jgi:hypothetical protein